MQISIIIPTLNEAQTIGHTLSWLREQQASRQVGEILVIDGGSTDDTQIIARAAGAVVYQTSPSRAIQMNYGAKIARFPLLYFVHADTRPPQGYDAHIVAAIENGAQMGCFRYRFDSPSRMLRINAWFTRFPWLFCQGGDKTFFISKMRFEALGAYDEALPIMEEYDFLKKAAREGIKCSILPHTVLVSARKYEGRSWLRVQIANLVAFNLWRFGWAAPAKIRVLYKRILG